MLLVAAPTTRDRPGTKRPQRVHQGAALVGATQCAIYAWRPERAAVMLSVNADVVELLIRAKNETQIELLRLDGHAHLRSVSLEALNLAADAPLTAVNS